MSNVVFNLHRLMTLECLPRSRCFSFCYLVLTLSMASYTASHDFRYEQNVTCQPSGTSGIKKITCSQGVSNVASTVACPRSFPGANRTYLFLLGYPRTGTSAAHFLLATSPSVSTLAPSGILSNRKEGWEMKMFPGALQALQDKLVSFKQLTTKSSINRWTIPADRIPWSKFDEDWHHRWNLSRPVLLENSPPEIRFPERLLQQYNDKGDVRFIILARSPCNY